MQDPLENPFWHAQAGPQRSLSLGNDLARRYPPGVAPQCSVVDPVAEAYAALRDLFAEEELVGLFQTEAQPVPGFETVVQVELQQMVFTASGGELAQAAAVTSVELDPEDVPDMLALAEATRPGPVEPGALSLGRFIGVREGGRLVAMAGERARLDNHREVSGVCTHPDFRGRGLARALVHELVASHLREGLTPFLHVEVRKAETVRHYRKWGFEPSRRLWVSVLRRDGTA